MIFRIMKHEIKPLGKMTLRIMTIRKTTLNIMTFSITTLIIAILSITVKNLRFGLLHYAEYRYTECLGALLENKNRI